MYIFRNTGTIYVWLILNLVRVLMYKMIYKYELHFYFVYKIISKIKLYKLIRKCIY